MNMDLTEEQAATALFGAVRAAAEGQHSDLRASTPGETTIEIGARIYRQVEREKKVGILLGLALSADEQRILLNALIQASDASSEELDELDELIHGVFR